MRAPGNSTALTKILKFLKLSCEDDHSAEKCELDRALVLAISEAKLPVYLDSECAPAIKTETGRYPSKVAVISIPKAGTYLIGRLLSLIGFIDTEIHVNTNTLSVYRQKTVEQKRNEPEKVLINLDLNYTVELIRSGQFIVGHLPKNEFVAACLSDFKKIFVFRDLRDAVISYMRFLASTDRGTPRDKEWKKLPEEAEKLLAFFRYHLKHILLQVESIIQWIEDKGVLSLSFEKLYGDFGPEKQLEAVRMILHHLNIPDTIDIEDIINKKLLGHETLTWSGKRSNRRQYWNDEAEQFFEELGGNRLNRLLGYQN